MGTKAILMGNEAIARGIVEAGCEVACAYPGTPSSEILPSIAFWADELKTKTQVEWGANEKIAFETALGATYPGKRVCAVMKQVGLDVAADPFMTCALTELNGGFVLIVSDDPGCHASQTDQDSRYFAMYAKIPCFDPSDAREAKEMTFDAFDVSEKYRIVTMLRPTVRVDHCRQDVELLDPISVDRPAKFDRQPVGHMIHLPARLIRETLPKHNERYARIAVDFETAFPKYNYEVPAKGKARFGIVAGGICFAAVSDILADLGRTDVSVLKIGTPVPLPVKMVEDFIGRHEKTLVLEETYPAIEMQLPDRKGTLGRWNGFVPPNGELTTDVIAAILEKFFGEANEGDAAAPSLAAARDALGLAVLPPRLCPGCGHRPGFAAIRKAYPNAIVCGDIGCYGLVKQQNAIDSIVSMGASITVASGMYLAHKADGKGTDRPIFAALGDSTFFHNGMPGLTTAVYNRHAIVVCIMDNGTTAMTGGQDNPGTGGKMRGGEEGVRIPIEDAAKGCGARHIVTVEAYELRKNAPVLREAWEYARKNQEPAVVIMRHPCLTKLKIKQERIPVTVRDAKCVGCKQCITNFNCPGLSFDETKKKAYIDDRFCVACGVCVEMCPQDAIVRREGE